MENLNEIIPFLIPIVLLQLILMIVALVDLWKRDQVRFGSKLLWALIIILINLIGPIIYLLFGRSSDNVRS